MIFIKLIFPIIKSFPDFQCDSAEKPLLLREPEWPAPGSEDTKIGVTMGPEVQYGGKATVYSGVQA
jgi:hypothetical protein